MLPLSDISVNGKTMSRIALGTHLFGRENADACHSILEKYFSGGGNVIDTGRVYHGGESEYVIGDFLRKNGMNNKAVIITKGGNAALPDGMQVVLPGSRVNAKCIEEDIKISLDTLGSENIDIYFVHKDNPETTVGEIIEVLNKYIKNGSLRHIGASNWTSARIAEANAYAAEHGLQPFEFSELAFSFKKNSTESWGAAEGALKMEKTDFDWYRCLTFSRTRPGITILSTAMKKCFVRSNLTRQAMKCHGISGGLRANGKTRFPEHSALTKAAFSMANCMTGSAMRR